MPFLLEAVHTRRASVPGVKAQYSCLGFERLWRTISVPCVIDWGLCGDIKAQLLPALNPASFTPLQLLVPRGPPSKRSIPKSLSQTCFPGNLVWGILPLGSGHNANWSWKPKVRSQGFTFCFSLWPPYLHKTKLLTKANTYLTLSMCQVLYFVYYLFIIFPKH